MWRVVLSLFMVIAVGAVAVAGAPRDAAEAAPNATITVRRPVLHCDGDATRIAVHAELSDGTLLANLPVYLSGGTFHSTYGTVVSNAYPAPVPVGYTNKHGDFRARFAPVSDGMGRWYLSGTVGSVTGQQAVVFTLGTCDFSDDTTYTVSGDVFYDDNANGVQDRGEKDAKRVSLEIGRPGTNGQTFIPFHETRSDRHGAFGWTGLFEYEAAYWPRLAWRVCLADGRRPLQIVSASGATISDDGGGGCLQMPLLSPGDNHIVVGVQRR